MPGLFGVASRNMKREAALRSLARMQELLRHRDDTLPPEVMSIVPQLGEAGALALGALWPRSEAGFRQDINDEATLFFYGEAFGDTAPLTPAEIVKMFSGLVLPRGDARALAKLDGTYSAAIADGERGVLHLFTDALGLQPLYVRETAGALWFSSELKGLLALGALEIDRLAASDFLRIGHFLGDSTWFQGVRLLPPASHLRYELATGRVVLGNYRTWPPSRREPDEDQGDQASLFVAGRTPELARSAEILGGLLEQAVLRRTAGAGRCGLWLSGGLDSRALFAAFPKAAEPIPVLSFGRPNCRDIHLALQVSALRPARHDIIEIHPDQGLQGREEGVWCTDGQLPFEAMQGFETLPSLEKTMDHCLSGAFGQALLGGGYLDDNRWTLWEKFLHLGRRQLLPGLHHAGTRIRFRLPFLDLKLIDAIASLPEAQLRDGRVYRHMLLKRWPEYFHRIPCQRTGRPLALRPSTEQRQLRFSATGRGLKRALRMKIADDGKQTLPVDAWMRTEKSQDFISANLFPETGFSLDAWTDMKALRHDWEMHLAGQDRSASLGRHLTAALWLRRVAQVKSETN